MYAGVDFDPDTLVIPSNVCSPDEILQSIKEVNMNKLDYVQSDIEGDMNFELNTKELTESEQSLDAPAITHKATKDMSQLTIAHAVIDEKRIWHNIEAGAFMVKGSDSDVYAITIYPKEQC